MPAGGVGIRAKNALPPGRGTIRDQDWEGDMTDITADITPDEFGLVEKAKALEPL